MDTCTSARRDCQHFSVLEDDTNVAGAKDLMEQESRDKASRS